MTTYESDVCIVGGGISAAMLAEKLAEIKPGVQITIAEAGRSSTSRTARDTGGVSTRRTPGGDFIDVQAGLESFPGRWRWPGARCIGAGDQPVLRGRSHAEVGYGLAADWRSRDRRSHYCEAERRLESQVSRARWRRTASAAPMDPPSHATSCPESVGRRAAFRSGFLRRNLGMRRTRCCAAACRSADSALPPDFTFAAARREASRYTIRRSWRRGEPTASGSCRRDRLSRQRRETGIARSLRARSVTRGRRTCCSCPASRTARAWSEST